MILNFKKIAVPFALYLSTVLVTNLYSQSTLNCDFSNNSEKRNKTFNFWDNENKIFSGPLNSPTASKVDNGGRSRNFNFVRTLGGWRTTVNGAAAKDFSGDLATFRNGQYVYDPSKMINKLKQFQTNGVNIQQIVLDNPPWVFQRGLRFVDEINNRDYLKSTEIETYGNAIPPNDNVEWRKFIRVVMDALVDEFGIDTVSKWRFRGGSEIETSGHWAGTKEQYFEHYKIITEEVKRAVPNAQVGVHLREANFRSNKLNYKGQVVKSFGREFIDWANENDIPYDFMGISYYPFFNRLDGGLGGLDVFKYYDDGIKPLVTNPNFNKNTSVEIHEFWLFTNFGNGLLVNVGTSHGSAFFVKLARLAYERGIKKINQWGYGQIGRLFSPQRMAMKLLKTVEGQDRYRYTSNINTRNSNTIDALFTTSKTEEYSYFNTIVSNYSHIPNYQTAKERVDVNMQLPFSPNTDYEYRIITYGQENCGFNKLKEKDRNYRLTESQGGWLKNGSNATYGHISKAMAGSGTTRRNRMNQLTADANSFESLNDFSISAWKSGKTSAIANSTDTSRFTKVINLESFMIQKIEVRVKETTVTNNPPTVTLTAPTEGQIFTVGEQISLLASANDTDGNLEKVNFKINDEFYKSDLERPFENSFVPTEAGNYVIGARAIDKDGLAQEVTVNIVVEAAQINNAPEVRITSPAEGAEFPLGEEITLSVFASDPDGNLEKVNFKINNEFYRSDLERPFTTTFTPLETGQYTIGARAIDKDGLAKEVNLNIIVNDVALSNNDFIKADNLDYLTIYPSPAANEINISGVTSKVELTLMDLTGKIVLITTLNKDQSKIDVSKLSKGIYFVKISSGNYLKSKSFLKK